MTLIYVSNAGTSVFNSQVIYLLNFLIENYHFKSIYLLIGITSEKEKNNISLELINSHIQILYYHKYGDYPIVQGRNIYSLKAVFKKFRFDNPDKITIHVRTEILGYYVMQAIQSLLIDTKNIKFLIDVRGAIYDEIKIYYSNFFLKSLKISLINKIHRYHVKNNSYISCVSNELKTYLINKYLYKSDRIIVNPCSYPGFFSYDVSQRKKLRKKMNLSDEELLVVFSTGGSSKWQKTDLIINNLKTIKSIKVLNLSKQIFDGENIYNFFVPITEMPSYLSAADVSIIIREDNLVNKVASPVKFSEYVACGLPVIANDSVSAISAAIRQNHIGLLLYSIGELNEEVIKKAARIKRGDIVNFAADNFSLKIISKSYYEFYQSG